MFRCKRIAFIMAIIALFLLQAGKVLAGPDDVEGHWAQEQIFKWLEKGWAELCEDGTFSPDEKITRGEFIALANRAFGFTESTRVNFSDLPEDHRYAEEIARAVAAGYISGFEDGTIRPDEQLSRLEAFTIVARIAELPRPEDSAVLSGFTDSEDVPEWARASTGAVIACGLVNGYPDGSLKPQQIMTRAEAITVLDNALGILGAANITGTGYLGIEPSVAESGIIKKIVVYYFLGENFTDGSVIFHLPPEITATEYQDRIVISDSRGKSEVFALGPRHIADGGKEVRLSGITAAENGVLLLILENKDVSKPDYYYFSITADADGAGEKQPTEDEIYETAELFARVPSEYMGILEVSPASAKSGSEQTFTLTYTLGDDFTEGWIQFKLPAEITATAGKDKIKIGDTEEPLAGDIISGDGRVVTLSGINAQKGDTVALIIYDKTIPETGPYLFAVKADADGEGAAKPATPGAGSEFVPFFAYSQVAEDAIGEKDLISSFIKAINGGDSETVIGFLAEDALYIDNYMDGYFDLYASMEDIAEEIEYMIEYYGAKLATDVNTLRKIAENVWQVEGKASDYFTTLTAGLNPDSGFDGISYTARFFMADKKISYIEFLWSREDEVLYDKLNEGNIGVFAYEGDAGEPVISACMPGMPAEKAGLKPGDIIAAVDGINVLDMDYKGVEAMYRLMGKAGSRVKLTIKRNGETFDLEIERAAY